MVLVKMKELFRSSGKRCGDPDGVMAVLQIARRLLSERGDNNVYGALDEAIDLAAPRDQSRAWWAAHRRVVDCLPAAWRGSNIGLFAESASHDEVLEVLAEAIREQGRANIVAAKGKRP